MSNQVWAFFGNVDRHSSAVFRDRKRLESWIEKYELSGMLQPYWIDDPPWERYRRGADMHAPGTPADYLTPQRLVGPAQNCHDFVGGKPDKGDEETLQNQPVPAALSLASQFEGQRRVMTSHSLVDPHVWFLYSHHAHLPVGLFSDKQIAIDWAHSNCVYGAIVQAFVDDPAYERALRTGSLRCVNPYMCSANFIANFAGHGETYSLAQFESQYDT